MRFPHGFQSTTAPSSGPLNRPGNTARIILQQPHPLAEEFDDIGEMSLYVRHKLGILPGKQQG